MSRGTQESLGLLVKMQVLIQQVWGKRRLWSKHQPPQVMQKLLVPRLCFE